MLAYFLPKMPEELLGLTDLARDMRWCWSHATDELWKALDPDLWESTRNPWVLLQAVSTKKLRSLASDPSFMKLLQARVREHEKTRSACCWFDECACKDELNHVAYFSMEYGLAEALPLYSGGLGILAGDTLKTASDLGVPMVGVGLLYQQGYFRQALDSEGRQREFFPYNDPVQMPVFPARNDDGEWVRVSIPLTGRRLRLERSFSVADSSGRFVYETIFSSVRPAHDYTLRVLARHPDASIPLETNAIHWQGEQS